MPCVIFSCTQASSVVTPFNTAHFAFCNLPFYNFDTSIHCIYVYCSRLSASLVCDFDTFVPFISGRMRLRAWRQSGNGYFADKSFRLFCLSAAYLFGSMSVCLDLSNFDFVYFDFLMFQNRVWYADLRCICIPTENCLII